MGFNLGGLDTSGITGNIRWDSADFTQASSVEHLVTFLTFLFGILVVLILFNYLLGIVNPKHKTYRELMTSMYVVGTIKKLADKDSINLNQELKEFASIIKKSNLNYEQLDKVVEAELAEKIVQEFEDSKNKNTQSKTNKS